MTLGKKIRHLRDQRGWSLRELAKRSGVGYATLSRIETGRLHSTITTHQKIAAAFGLPLTELCRDTVFDAQAVALPAPLTARSLDVETFTYDRDASAVLLARQVLDKKMMPQLILLQPGGRTHVEQASAGSEKWLFLLEGAVEAQIDTQCYPLRAEETLYFDASRPHQLINTGAAPARCISVTTPVGL